MSKLEPGYVYRLSGHGPGHGVYVGRKRWLVLDGDQLSVRIGLKPACHTPVNDSVPTDYAHAYGVLSKVDGTGRSWTEEIRVAQTEAMELVGGDAAVALSHTLGVPVAQSASAPGSGPVTAPVITVEPTTAPGPRVHSFDA